MSQQPRVAPARRGGPRTRPATRAPRVSPQQPQVTFNWSNFPVHKLPAIRELPDDMREDDLLSITLNLALHWDWCAVHFRPAMRQSGGYSTPVQGMKGSPDLFLARNGVIIHAELKSNRGSLRPEQRVWRDHLGAAHRLWRPRDWPNIVAELRPTA